MTITLTLWIRGINGIMGKRPYLEPDSHLSINGQPHKLTDHPLEIPQADIYGSWDSLPNTATDPTRATEEILDRGRLAIKKLIGKKHAWWTERLQKHIPIAGQLHPGDRYIILPIPFDEFRPSSASRFIVLFKTHVPGHGQQQAELLIWPTGPFWDEQGGPLNDMTTCLVEKFVHMPPGEVAKWHPLIPEALKHRAKGSLGVYVIRFEEAHGGPVLSP